MTTGNREMPPDPTSMIFWLKNWRRQDWRDVHKLEADPNTMAMFAGIKIVISDKPEAPAVIDHPSGQARPAVATQTPAGWQPFAGNGSGMRLDLSAPAKGTPRR